MEYTVTSCRDCDRMFPLQEFVKGIFYIPSLRQWFGVGEWKISRRSIDPSLILYYCIDCFCEKALKMVAPHQCAHCHVHMNAVMGPTIHLEPKEIWGYSAIGDYKIIKTLPYEAKTGDNLCLDCLDRFTSLGCIKRIKGTCLLRPEYLSKDDVPEVDDDPPHKPLPEPLICGKCGRSEKYDSIKYKNRKEQWVEFKNKTSCVGLRCGEYITLQPFSPLFDSLLVCNECFAYIPHQPKESLECDFCKTKYEVIQECERCVGSAYECEGSVSEEGAHYDGEGYVWVNGIMPAVFKKYHNICYPCLQDLVRQKVLKSNRDPIYYEQKIGL